MITVSFLATATRAFLDADPLYQSEPQGIECGEFGNPGQKNIGCFVEQRSDHLVAALRYPSLIVDISGLMVSRSQT